MASRLSRFTEFYGTSASEDKRHHSEGQVQMPGDISDPHTWKDESKIKRREWIGRNKRMLVTLVILGTISTIILIIWFGRLLPQVFANEYVRTAMWYGGIIGATVYLSIRWYRSSIEEFDWLVLIYSDSVKRYLGHYDTTEAGDPAFIPVKGFSMMGLRGNPLTLGDMSTEMARQFSKTDRKADDPAKILLRPSMCSVSNTQYGTVVAQLTSGLEPFETGHETDIVATVPELADKDQMHDLRQELQEQVSENSYLKDQNSMLRDQKQNYKETALAKEGEIQQRMINFARNVLEASQGTGGGGYSAGGMDPYGPEPDFTEMEQEIDEELNDDF